MDDLAASLRAWRDRLTPVDPGPRRRAPGMRREEIAQLAGLSVGYLTRLEQGRAHNPSPLVCSALARALRLSADERQTLFRLAGHAAPAGRIDREITPGVRRMIERLGDLPILVCDAAWQVIAKNDLARALLGDVHGNTARQQFLGPPGSIIRSPEEDAEFEAGIVADLHAALARFPADEPLQALIAELRRESPRFEALWRQRPAGAYDSSRKTVDHPQLGPITVDCDTLTVVGGSLRIIVYSAPPGTPAAEALARLGAGELALSR
jgi:transcriptional regulator with XRE-family HTH domain